MKIEQVAVSELQAHPKNVRVHGDLQIRELAKSVGMFGTLRPIIIDENNMILAGHALWEAYKSLGRDSCDCMRVVGLSETEKTKLMLSDNKIFQLGVDNFQNMDEIFHSLSDFDIPGYNPEDLAAIYAPLEDDDTDHLEGYVISREDAERKQALNLEPKVATVRQEKTEVKVEIPSGKFGGSQGQSEPEEKIENFVICPHCGGKVILC